MADRKTGANDSSEGANGGSLEQDFFVGAGERDAAQIVRDASKISLPKRFYKDVAVEASEGVWRILLDGRPIRTPRQTLLALPSERVASLVAEEWAAQGQIIDPTTMPATRLVNVALDGVAVDLPAVAADVVKYAGSDLLCYRAAEPPSLVRAQAAAWDPVLDGLRTRLGARFVLAEGIVFTRQPPEAIAAVAGAVEAIAALPAGALRIAALHVVTTLTGSALLALAVSDGSLSGEAAWSAAHVDEDEQMRVWGFDAEALRRRASRFVDMRTACAILDILRG